MEQVVGYCFEEQNEGLLETGEMPECTRVHLVTVYFPTRNFSMKGIFFSLFVSLGKHLTWAQSKLLFEIELFISSSVNFMFYSHDSSQAETIKVHWAKQTGEYRMIFSTFPDTFYWGFTSSANLGCIKLWKVKKMCWDAQRTMNCGSIRIGVIWGWIIFERNFECYLH